jgi:hypothetical protein
MTDPVVVIALTSCQVSDDGEEIRLSVRDNSGAPLDLQISAEQAGSLAMTLPKLISTALKARYRDPTLRLVYPLTDYSLEGAEGSQDRILSLKTTDGFEVSFSVTPGTLAAIGQLIVSHELAPAERHSLH